MISWGHRSSELLSFPMDDKYDTIRQFLAPQLLRHGEDPWPIISPNSTTLLCLLPCTPIAFDLFSLVAHVFCHHAGHHFLPCVCARVRYVESDVRSQISVVKGRNRNFMSINGRAHVLDRDLDRYHYDEILSAILFDTGYNRTTSYQQMCAVFNKTLATFATDSSSSSAAAAPATARGAHTSSRTYVTGSTLVMQIDGVSSQWTSLSNGRRRSGADAFVDTSRMFMPLLVSFTFGVGVSTSTSSYNASFQGDAGESAHTLWCHFCMNSS